MKARVLRTKPEPLIALEPDGEGDRRVLERLLAMGVRLIPVGIDGPLWAGGVVSLLPCHPETPAIPETVARPKEAVS